MSFQRDLKFGNAAEVSFVAKWADKLQLLDGFNGDFKIISTNQKIELKTDRRAASDTGNIFIERYSHKDKQTPGGPYKAQLVDCTFFIYLFAHCGTYYTFNTAELVALVEAMPNKKPFNVKVGGSNAMGYLVPITLLSPIAIELEKYL